MVVSLNSRLESNKEEEKFPQVNIAELFGSDSGTKHHNLCSERALPTETKVESVTSQSKSGTSVNLSNSGIYCKFVPSHVQIWGSARITTMSNWPSFRQVKAESKNWGREN